VGSQPQMGNVSLYSICLPILSARLDRTMAFLGEPRFLFVHTLKKKKKKKKREGAGCSIALLSIIEYHHGVALFSRHGDKRVTTQLPHHLPSTLHPTPPPPHTSLPPPPPPPGSSGQWHGSMCGNAAA